MAPREGYAAYGSAGCLARAGLRLAPPGRLARARRSTRRVAGYSPRIRTETQEVALLRILIAAGERAIEAFQASDNIKDRQLLADLERVVERSRGELAVLLAEA